MIEVEALFIAASEMRSDNNLRRLVRAEIEFLFNTSSYQQWLRGGLAEREPLRVDVDTRCALLQDLRIVEKGRLRVKLNAIGERLFATDGIWVDRRVRVFPFSDESEALLRYVGGQGRGADEGTIVDLATGCGHNAIGIGGAARRFAFDVSPRALAFTTFNRCLNGIEGGGFTAALNDVRDGIPDFVEEPGSGSMLFLANMPFGPAPSPGVLPASSHGGEGGADLTIATLSALRRSAERVGGHRPFRACILGLTVGRASENSWEIVKAAQELFGPDKVRWTLLGDEKLFRISGVRELDNPSSVATALPRIADCGLYVRNEDREEVRSGYQDLAARLEVRGHPEIAYGVVDINFTE